MRFATLLSCLCVAMTVARSSPGIDLDLLRLNGGATARAAGINDAQEDQAGANYLDAPDIAMGSASVVPEADTDQGPTAQATASANEMSGSNSNVGAAGRAFADLEVQGGGSGGWLEATVTLQTVESGAQTSGGAGFGDAALLYQGGILFALIPGELSDPIDSDSALHIRQYVEDQEVITVYAEATAGLAAFGFSSTNFSCTAFGKVVADPDDDGEPNSVQWVKGGVVGGGLEW